MDLVDDKVLLSLNISKSNGNGDAKDGSCLGKGNGCEKNDEGDAFGNKGATYGELIARMPAEKFATHYNMSHKHRGVALIFNHEIFEIHSLKRRAGTEQDRHNLQQVLKLLGFEVHEFQDLRFNEIDEHINYFSSMDHNDHDCLIVAVLTHGDTGALYARDKPYSPEYLFSRFTADRCLSLAGKPKVFLFQACQGDKLDGGVVLSKTETDGQPLNSYRIPSQADFLIVYSTVLGFYSWRNTTRGSWFIQALCEELRRRAFDMDLVTILTFVAQRVALDYESNVPDSPTMHQQKQVPCVMSRLTRLIQFSRDGSNNDAIHSKQEKPTNTKRGLFSKGKK